MQINSHDVSHVLRKERQWHLHQLERIDRALEASSPQQTSLSPRKKVSWQQEIEQLFQIHQTLRAGEVIQLLVDKGITDAGVITRKINVYATLAQMANDGMLTRIERGVYQKNV